MMSTIVNKLKLDNNKPVVLATQHGIISFVNPEFETLFQWSSEEIVNQPLSVIIPAHLHNAHNIGFSRFITTGKPVLLGQSLDLLALKKNGEQFNAVHLIQAIKEDGAWIIGANISLADSE